MIGYLEAHCSGPTRSACCWTSTGVGYEVNVPLSTWYEIEKRRGEERIRLFIHTHMREDGIALFGFWTEREKRMFEKLIGVNGIGPRLARVILSGMAPDDLIGAIAAGDLGRLGTIPGSGQEDRRADGAGAAGEDRELAADLPETATAAAPADHDVVSALVNLGYKANLAERAVAEVRREKPDAAFNDLLRASLNRLSRA